MSDPVRDLPVGRLRRVAAVAPDLRFGQVVAHLALVAAGPWDETLWDVEDEEMLRAIRKLEADLIARGASMHTSGAKLETLE